MADSLESSLAQVGLRDFLFYVVPGSLLLASIMAWSGVTGEDLQPYLDVLSAIAAIVAVYFLGQCAYAFSYPVRWLIARIGRLKSLEQEAHVRGFRLAYRKAADLEKTYFAIEVFRYRTMARFCSVMILPLLLFTAGLAFGEWRLSIGARLVAVLTGLAAAAGFGVRYYLYQCRYRGSLAS